MPIMYNFNGPISRICPYWIGIIVGYFIFILENTELNKRKEIVEKLRKVFIHGFLTLNIAMIPIIGVLMKTIDLHFLYFTLESFVKICVPMTLGLLFMILHFGSFDGMNAFLSMSMWKPFAKLSFSIYLLSPVMQIILVYTKNVKNSINSDDLVSGHIIDNKFM